MPARNRQLTEKRIRDAARKILSESGFEQWGINAISREAGVDKVLIYRYFQSADGLRQTLIDSSQFWPDPDALPSASPEAYVRETIRLMRHERHAWVLLTDPRSGADNPRLKERFENRLKIWESGLSRFFSGSSQTALTGQVSACVLSAVLTGSDELSWKNLWEHIDQNHDFSGSETDDDLPVELL